MSVIKVDTTVLDRIVKEMPDKVEKVGRKMAYMISRRAKMHSPVDTGALRESIHVKMKPWAGVLAIVGPTVEYAEYQEFGTHKMAAHPYLTPAVEEVSEEFNSPANWESIVS